MTGGRCVELLLRDMMVVVVMVVVVNGLVRLWLGVGTGPRTRTTGAVVDSSCCARRRLPLLCATKTRARTAPSRHHWHATSWHVYSGHRSSTSSSWAP